MAQRVRPDHPLPTPTSEQARKSAYPSPIKGEEGGRASFREFRGHDTNLRMIARNRGVSRSPSTQASKTIFLHAPDLPTLAGCPSPLSPRAAPSTSSGRHCWIRAAPLEAALRMCFIN